MAAQASRANSPSSALHGVTRPSSRRRRRTACEIGIRQAERAQERAMGGAIQSLNRDARGSFGILIVRVILSAKTRRTDASRCAGAAAAVRQRRCVVAGLSCAGGAHRRAFATGGPADIYARFVAPSFRRRSATFRHRGSRRGGSIVGTDVVAKSPPDGYTLLMMSNTHTVNETLIPKKPFDLMRDLAPISGVNYSDLLMVITLPFRRTT